MIFTDIYRGAEKALAFTMIGMVINFNYPISKSILKTATIIAGVNCFLDYKSDNYESIAACSIIAPIYLIHNTFFGESSADYCE
ncbi:MAG: hypothetical protein N4A31_00820 [Rickettsiales bacterium]|jgi:hypothetical protein|nr:hypothetical protein [Rickettsiales bacterium]